MKFSNPKLKVCVDLTMGDADIRQRRVKLLQLLEMIDKTNEVLRKVEKTPSEGMRDDREQVVRLLNQTTEFLETREDLL